MRRLLVMFVFLISFNCHAYHKNKFGEIIYTKKDLIEMEIALCDRLPMNKIFSCLIRINNK